MYFEIERINTLVFNPCDLELTEVETEAECKEYFAHHFKLNGQNIKLRTAKITPTKTGQFVTLWKRNQKGITEPYSIFDNVDFYLILTQKETKVGLFIFPKTVLHAQKILSDKTRDGKRGFRVYSPWDITTNKQAQKTQHWQINYFLDLPNAEQIDLKRAKTLLK